MWDDLVRGAIGAVVLVDTRRLADCFPAVDYFENSGLPVRGRHQRLRRPPAPPEEVREALQIGPRGPDHHHRRPAPRRGQERADHAGGTRPAGAPQVAFTEGKLAMRDARDPAVSDDTAGLGVHNVSGEFRRPRTRAALGRCRIVHLCHKVCRPFGLMPVLPPGLGHLFPRGGGLASSTTTCWNAQNPSVGTAVVAPSPRGCWSSEEHEASRDGRRSGPAGELHAARTPGRLPHGSAPCQRTRAARSGRPVQHAQLAGGHPAERHPPHPGPRRPRVRRLPGEELGGHLARRPTTRYASRPWSRPLLRTAPPLRTSATPRSFRSWPVNATPPLSRRPTPAPTRPRRSTTRRPGTCRTSRTSSAGWPASRRSSRSSPRSAGRLHQAALRRADRGGVRQDPPPADRAGERAGFRYQQRRRVRAHHYALSLTKAAESLTRSIGMHILVERHRARVSSALQKTALGSYEYLQGIALEEYRGGGTAGHSPAEGSAGCGRAQGREGRRRGSARGQVGAHRVRGPAEPHADGHRHRHPVRHGRQLRAAGVTPDSYRAASTLSFDAYGSVEVALADQAAHDASHIAATARRDTVINAAAVVGALIIAFIVTP